MDISQNLSKIIYTPAFLFGGWGSKKKLPRNGSNNVVPQPNKIQYGYTVPSYGTVISSVKGKDGTLEKCTYAVDAGNNMIYLFSYNRANNSLNYTEMNGDYNTFAQSQGAQVHVPIVQQQQQETSGIGGAFSSGFKVFGMLMILLGAYMIFTAKSRRYRYSRNSYQNPYNRYGGHGY